MRSETPSLSNNALAHDLLHGCVYDYQAAGCFIKATATLSYICCLLSIWFIYRHLLTRESFEPHIICC